MTPSRARALLLLAAPLLAPLAGCDETANTATPPATPASGPAAPAATTPAQGYIELPFSMTATPMAAGLPLLLISKQSISMYGDPSWQVPLPPPDRWMAGVDAAYKRGELSIPLLEAALARLRVQGGDTLAVGVDRTIPYRILVEALYTAGQAGYTHYHLVVRSGGGYGALVTAPPSPGPRALNLTVTVATSGLSVRTAMGPVGPGCAVGTPGTTATRTPAGHDFIGLRTCIAALKQRDPRFAAEQEATLVAHPDVTYADMIGVMDTVRVDVEGRPLLPAVSFAVLR